MIIWLDLFLNVNKLTFFYFKIQCFIQVQYAQGWRRNEPYNEKPQSPSYPVTLTISALTFYGPTHISK